MTRYDPAAFLEPLDGDSPTGSDLEYDPDFLALERAAAPRAERAMGDSVKAAEEPDWDEVHSLATGLLERSRDLRVATHLATAWMRSGGMSGWAAGLALVRGLLENHWDTVHPQLDAEDDDDPTARVNAVAAIANPLGLLGYFRHTPFVHSPRVGRFSLRDLRIANGTLKIETDDETPPGMTEIEACCLDCPEEQLAETLEAVSRILDEAKAIDQIFNDRIGTAGPDLKPLLSDSYELKKFVESRAALRNPALADGGDAEADGAEPGAPGVRASVPGRIETPQDVMRRIDEICEYYARSEPSSPVPLLLRRAQRLVGKNFLDLLKDLAPGGVSEMEVISGPGEE
ncbi:type VI secretion system protein TssA [Frateuria sp. STR12]|uniref:type VI secretion system protein TssA n=1 Tax=Frateuria hangzhouensis TaxID=2995589 RepID=UPI0022609D51|nr:type VI secretion system protein TssA [Frateuria sp. STR12]MCX7514351.1 type VI secretion system protein TssA [Frateuria sp. STR12]